MASALMCGGSPRKWKSLPALSNDFVRLMVSNPPPLGACRRLLSVESQSGKYVGRRRGSGGRLFISAGLNLDEVMMDGTPPTPTPALTQAPNRHVGPVCSASSMARL